MDTTIVHWGLYGDNGKENGNHYSILRSLAWWICGLQAFFSSSAISGQWVELDAAAA